MKTILEKKRKQDLGIFYTRPEIVDFIYDILLVWKEKEDKEKKRWESHKPKHYPSVIDPACGEGIFVKRISSIYETEPLGNVNQGKFLNGVIKLNGRNEVIIDPKTNMTSIPGIFAAGDVTDVPHKQMIIAAGEGAKAALSAYEYLKSQRI